jgi:antitoxin PrlF
MPKRRTNEAVDACSECCHVQALVRIDDRGQMVLPKDVRERMGLRGGDKLALSVLETGGRVCCLVLTRADDLGAVVKGILSAATGEGERE